MTRTVLKRVKKLAGLPEFVGKIAAHCCAVTDSSRITCWGGSKFKSWPNGLQGVTFTSEWTADDGEVEARIPVLGVVAALCGLSLAEQELLAPSRPTPTTTAAAVAPLQPSATTGSSTAYSVWTSAISYPYPSYVAYTQPASPYYISGTPVYTYASAVPVYSNAYTPASNPTYNRSPSSSSVYSSAPPINLNLNLNLNRCCVSSHQHFSTHSCHFVLVWIWPFIVTENPLRSLSRLIIQIHHTTPAGNGETHRVRFVHVAFNETGEQLAAADHRGNIFIIDLNSNKMESGKPLKKSIPSTLDWDSNLDLPVITSPVNCESDTLDHSATEADFGSSQILESVLLSPFPRTRTQSYL
uniref:Uncharacterized protein n=1 Tax=Timema tahoe TaxID=61484 RepID=A0A7R9IIE3_9NEOP|nr:unnamed protein product [Timema tahoe]